MLPTRRAGSHSFPLSWCFVGILNSQVNRFLIDSAAYLLANEDLALHASSPARRLPGQDVGCTILVPFPLVSVKMPQGVEGLIWLCCRPNTGSGRNDEAERVTLTDYPTLPHSSWAHVHRRRCAVSPCLQRLDIHDQRQPQRIPRGRQNSNRLHATFSAKAKLRKVFFVACGTKLESNQVPGREPSAGGSAMNGSPAGALGTGKHRRDHDVQ